ncbi:MAG: nucleoside phosphorylase [Actinomycetota bacterium]
MQFPQHGDKHGHPSYVTADRSLSERAASGESQAPPPETVIVTWQRSLLDHARDNGATALDGWGGVAHQLSPSLGLIRLPIGAPVVAVIMEELAALGVQTIVGIGTAGALSAELDIGDVVVCSAAVRDEGTSYHYAPPARFAHPDDDLVRRLGAALPDASLGPTWTTDAPYRETLHEIESYRRDGILVVEMEAAAMYAVAERLGMAAATVVCISDLLHGDTWHPHFRSDRTTEALNQTFDAVRELFDSPPDPTALT